MEVEGGAMGLAGVDGGDDVGKGSVVGALCLAGRERSVLLVCFWCVASVLLMCCWCVGDVLLVCC